MSATRVVRCPDCNLYYVSDQNLGAADVDECGLHPCEQCGHQHLPDFCEVCALGRSACLGSQDNADD